MTEAAVPPIEEVLADSYEFFSVTPEGDGTWIGRTPGWFGPRLFGGFVLAQAAYALTRTAPDGTRLHSFHSYFLSPVATESEVTYRIRSLRDGRSFSSRHLEAEHDGRVAFTMTGSFTTDREGYEYGRPLDPSTPGPDSGELLRDEGPWEAVRLGPTEPGPDGVMTSTARRWTRVRGPMIDDPHMHAAFLSILSDTTERGARPLLMDTDDVSGIISLDHSVWFHRPSRADQWHWFDTRSHGLAGGRGLATGDVLRADGTHVATIAQQILLRRNRST